MDSLTLKWGTLKAWDLKSDAALKAAQRYADIGEHSMGAATQHDTAEQKQALCDLIDALDCETVYLDWDGKDVSKDEAKRYVTEYGATRGAA